MSKTLNIEVGKKYKTACGCIYKMVFKYGKLFIGASESGSITSFNEFGLSQNDKFDYTIKEEYNDISFCLYINLYADGSNGKIHYCEVTANNESDRMSAALIEMIKIERSYDESRYNS